MIKDNFLGIPDKFSNKEGSKIILIPVPFEKTTSYIQGTKNGPKAIIEASKNLELYDIETDFEVFKNGIFTDSEKKYSSSEEMILKLEKKVTSYLKEDKFVVTIGGEHSVSLAPIKAHMDHFQKISVLQFDAHADLMMAYENDPYSHASVMARVSELSNISNIVSVGIRSMDVSEKKIQNTKNTFFSHDIHNDSNWMEKACSLLSDTVYITFDLDVFDSSLMPSTGTPEPGGLFWHQITQFLKLVAKRKKIIGFDVVELCPIPNFIAPDFLTAKLIYKLLSYVFHNKGDENGN